MRGSVVLLIIFKIIQPKSRCLNYSHTLISLVSFHSYLTFQLLGSLYNHLTLFILIVSSLNLLHLEHFFLLPFILRRIAARYFW